MQTEYLEIVAIDVEAVCAAYEASLGVSFSAPVPELGEARTADLADGSRVGVRAPMHATEDPVVRPYWLVDDIEEAVAKAVSQGFSRNSQASTSPFFVAPSMSCWRKRVASGCTRTLVCSGAG